MGKGRNFITFEATDEEKEILRAYCEQEGRTQTDVLRTYIRTLKRKIKNDTPPAWSCDSSHAILAVGWIAWVL